MILNSNRDRVGQLLATVAAASVAVLVLAASGLAATPRPKGVYVGQLVNEDTVTMNVSADGKTASLTLTCQDLGETDTFARFPIVNGVFKSTIYAPNPNKIPAATLRGNFTSVTQASIFIDEYASLHHHICYGTKSPATLTLKTR